MLYPDATDWLEVHTRFTQGDKAAWEEIAGCFLAWLCQILKHRRPGVDEQLIAESVENALLGYRKRPQHFDANRGVFLGYWLLMQARGHLSHLLRREKRYQVKERAVGVADKIFERFLSGTHSEMAIYIGRHKDETEQQKRSILDKLLLRLSPHDLETVKMMQAGAPIQTWVEHLGIAHLPTVVHKRNISAAKCRLKKKLQRLARSRTLASG